MGAFAPSAYQAGFFDWVQQGSGHAVLNAKAGAGKTTSIVKAARLIQGTARFFAFNVHSKDALAAELRGTPCRATTVHGYGYGVLARNLGRLIKHDDKYDRLAKDYIQYTMTPMLRAQLRTDKHAAALVRAREQGLAKLCNYARLTLTKADDLAGLGALIGRFDIVLATPECETAICKGVAPVLSRGLELAEEQGIIDYTDMLWIPVTLPGMQFDTTDWGLVDECQDLSAAARTLIGHSRAPGGRLVFVGDVHQAIMGFAGADTQSYYRIIEDYRASVLPLSICYRCPSRHLDLARLLVPDIENRPGAPTGSIAAIHLSAAAARIGNGALVMSRTTAPLLSLCFALLALGKPARVRGRDIGKGLCDLARAAAEVGMDTGEAFLEALSAYEAMQVNKLLKKAGSEKRIESLRDRVEAVRVCWLGFKVSTVAELCDRIAAIFADKDASIWLSTVHRAKGLEADDVFLLNPRLLPWSHPKQTAEDVVQEHNILYVALTRSKDRLTFVHADSEPLPPENDDLGNLDLNALS